MLVLHNLLGRKPFAEDPVRPYLIGNDDRHENQCYHRHDLQRIDTGRGIEYGQIVFRIDAGRDKAWEQADHAGKRDHDYGQARRRKSLHGLIPLGEVADRKKRDYCDCRYSKQQRHRNIIIIQSCRTAVAPRKTTAIATSGNHSFIATARDRFIMAPLVRMDNHSAPCTANNNTKSTPVRRP